MQKNCIVVGGGIIGLCAAYYLSKEGHKVTIIDKDSISNGASFINAGYITPSHIIPLSSPGIINKGLKWMLNSRSPFYVKPRLNAQFLKWAWNFKKSATTGKVKKAIPIIKDINLLSRELYEEMKRSQDFAFTYERNGLLMCYNSAKGEEEEANLAEMAELEGLNVTHFTKQDLSEQFPDANYDVRGAWYYADDGHMTPNDFMTQMRDFLERNSVKFLTNTEVLDFKIKENTIGKLLTDNGDFEVDEVVLAAGSWSSILGKKLGLNILVEAGKGYSFNVYRDLGVKIPSVLVEAKVAVTPMNGFTRFAGTMELGGINDLINPVRVEAIANAAENYFSKLKISSEEKASVKSGLRPCSPDGIPFIGRPDKYRNLTIGTGHAMMGWSLGPATGKLISEIISARRPSLNLEPFEPDRKF